MLRRFPPLLGVTMLPAGTNGSTAKKAAPKIWANCSRSMTKVIWKAFWKDMLYHDHLTILLCGATGSGKTTMSKTLVDAIDPAERLITIEDTLELVIPQPNHVRLLYSKDDIGLSHVTAESLLQASLRMRPDRVLVQELRDDAAGTYINEVVSGHPGSITSIHGRDAPQGFKLFSLVKGSPQFRSWDDDTLIALLSTMVDVIIPFENRANSYAIGEVWFAADAQRRR